MPLQEFELFWGCCFLCIDQEIVEDKADEYQRWTEEENDKLKERIEYISEGVEPPEEYEAYDIMEEYT